MNKFLKGFTHAIDGIASTYKTELNFRFHAAALVVVLFAGLFFELSATEWMWVALSCTLVLAAELFNTALEALSDALSTAYHPLIKRAKDAAAAAVLITALFSLVVGLLVFIPKIRLFFEL